MAASVDLELKKAFTELQAKVIDTQQKVKLADIQIEQLNRTKKHAHLTDTEIMTLVDETNMYEGVGRMFILQSKEVIHNQLLDKQKIAEEKIKELEDFSSQTRLTGNSDLKLLLPPSAGIKSIYHNSQPFSPTLYFIYK
ncbi:prefoldin subunit 1 isoform X1 [Arvicanthis niloticus]|uniref:prefoldin subunit 1 isoform X1 n=1 Tax=Arvicanthis niloticus TaxID=61156 RepID=UPI00402BB5D7